MNAVSQPFGKISRLKRGILFLLILSLMCAIFSTVFAPQAEAASYKVKMWKEDNTYNYFVYSGSLPAYYIPTFYRTPEDIYTSNGIKFFFYTQFEDTNAAETDAFVRYLGNKTQTSWTSGYYTITYNSYTQYFPYIITGWNCDRDSINKILNNSPYISSDGTQLHIEYIGSGNLVSQRWSSIRNDRKCSSAIYLSKPNVTIGFRFMDKYGNPLNLYCL